MTAFNDRKPEVIDAATIGGQGYYHRDRFADAEALGGVVETFAKITLEPHTVMGYHQHQGNFEFYYILKGEGKYNDNGTVVPCKPGDVFKCPDGEYHGIENTGDDILEFVALIVKSV